MHMACALGALDIYVHVRMHMKLCRAAGLGRPFNTEVGWGY